VADSLGAQLQVVQPVVVADWEVQPPQQQGRGGRRQELAALLGERLEARRRRDRRRQVEWHRGVHQVVRLRRVGQRDLLGPRVRRASDHGNVADH